MSDDLNPKIESGNDELSTGLKILSACIPLAGAIIYFMKKDGEPKSAKTACYAALIGAGIYLVLNIVSFLMGGMG